MIRHDVVQGTTAWAQLRVGIPTASRFDEIITPGKLQLSKSCDKYAHELIAEQILGVPLDNATSGFMERGTVLEKKAVSYYELQKDVEVDRVGFVTRDDGRVGCSPDGLIIGEPGGVEIKVPSAGIHVGYLLGSAGEKYKLQVQGCIWLCELDYWDFVSYNPDLPSTIVRFNRDDDIIKPLAAGVDQFIGYLHELKLQLQEKYGLFPALKPAPLKVVA